VLIGGSRWVPGAWLALWVAGCVSQGGAASHAAPDVGGEAGTVTGAGTAEPTASVEPSVLDYQFALDAKLTTLTARLCPSGAPPAQLVPGMRSARTLLRRAVIVRGAERIELPTDARGVRLAGLRRSECVVYELDLSAESSGWGSPMLRRSGSSLMVNLAALLWRPTSRDRDD